MTAPEPESASWSLWQQAGEIYGQSTLCVGNQLVVPICSFYIHGTHLLALWVALNTTMSKATGVSAEGERASGGQPRRKLEEVDGLGEGSWRYAVDVDGGAPVLLRERLAAAWGEG